MPMSADFHHRLSPILPRIAETFGTPFHIYDEIGIRSTGERLKRAFAGVAEFREYYAVKALPNPAVLRIMAEMGFGFDCSSIPEIELARRVGAAGEDILFTSNNTTVEEMEACLAVGGILNLDDVTLIPKVPSMPELICFRYNPGPRRTGNAIIGNPVEAKYGVAHGQIVDAYREARDRGARRFGLHTMICSNERNAGYFVETVRMLLAVVEEVQDALGIRFEFVNMGGGLGIPYRPEDEPLDLESMATRIAGLLEEFGRTHGYVPRLLMESGRYMTGPHGVLVTRCINHKHIYREYVGVDACMSALMRPAIYGAYHHVTVHGKEDAPADTVVDVVGALCENNDKFAVQRALPRIEEGDLVLVHDTGAHGHAMGFNYNGRLRPQELLLRADGTVERIRRAETADDYFATLNFEPEVWRG
ncbi:type III PLP-dependent enzyme domain-containing protein [Deferrisoma camini]|uniref:diaminopimelate decarboxylase n=1 Tax=Deferrisoma camini TaxID=1035120 RepID=UPI00046D0E81